MHLFLITGSLFSIWFVNTVGYQLNRYGLKMMDDVSTIQNMVIFLRKNRLLIYFKILPIISCLLSLSIKLTTKFTPF